MEERLETAREPERVEHNTTVINTGGRRSSGTGVIALVAVLVIAVVVFLALGGRGLFGGGKGTDIDINVKAPDIHLPKDLSPDKPSGEK